MAGSREFDLVVFGATGDAGRAVVHLLADSAPPSLRWTIAGRSLSKLQRVRSAAGLKPHVGVSVVDCFDESALVALASRTRVLLSAAGPYSVLGERVMTACIESGTHYVDITGEVPWVAEMRRKHGGRALAAGVCMASFCGYDCVPGELSVYLARQALGRPLSFAESVVDLGAGEGGAPRGTLLTTLTLMHDLAGFARGVSTFVPRAQRRPMLTSLLACLLPRWSAHVGGFTMPHFMFWCNIPIVHASAACVDIDATATTGHGPALRFRDAMLLPHGGRWFTLYGLLPLVAAYVGVALFSLPVWLLLALPPLKRAAQRLLLGRYSYGGSRTATTRFCTRAVAVAPAAAASASTGTSSATVELQLPGDAGIYATALLALTSARAMLAVLDGHAAAGPLAASTSTPSGALPAGMCTPVAALGDALVAQLREVPGVRLEVTVEEPPPSRGKLL